LLNDIFSEFDDLAQKHGIEKIKTVGDAYMAAGGLGSRNSVGTTADSNIGLNANYVEAMADISLEMLAFISKYVAPNGQSLSLRIGIATGPVVAGVIGRRKFSYDLWGDTVNIASRMCSEAQANCTQVDAVTFRRLHNRYAFDPGQQIHIKGKGPMNVYNLIGKTVPGLRSESAFLVDTRTAPG
jgi:class 3 adenylate cyclase